MSRAYDASEFDQRKPRLLVEAEELVRRLLPDDAVGYYREAIFHEWRITVNGRDVMTIEDSACDYQEERYAKAAAP